MTYDYHLWLSIAIFIVTAIAMFSGKWSLGLISMISMLLFVLTGCIDGSTALSGLSNSATIIMGSIYIISDAFSRTKLPRAIAGLVNKVSKGSYLKVLFGLCLATFLIGQFVPSSIGVFSICFPVALALCDELDFPKGAVIWSVGIIAITTGSVLPIGSSAVSYIEWNALLESYDYTVYMADFMDKFINRFPSVIIIFLYCLFVAPKIVPSDKTLVGSVTQSQTAKKELAPLSDFQETMGAVIFFGVIAAMITFQLHKIDLWIICMAGAILIVLCGLMKPREVYPALGMGGGMIFVNIGMLAMGNALNSTGAAQLLGDQVVKLLGSSPTNLSISAVFTGFSALITQFLINAPVRNIMNAICIMSCKQIGCDPIGQLANIYLGANMSILTPLACSTVPMMMGVGGFKLKDLIKMGLPLVIITVVVTAVWTAFALPAFH